MRQSILSSKYTFFKVDFSSIKRKYDIHYYSHLCAGPLLYQLLPFDWIQKSAVIDPKLTCNLESLGPRDSKLHGAQGPCTLVATPFSLENIVAWQQN
ncbi:jg13025 [Pararge aegeria aegeria]|uniref:Jg13025 protein n=1 Tax=Pararge aegeria aegeria TaxID=348720 RepID=A0A8S4RJW0_9NEOP|nr:jg13025 [Pararge aegeria aegeria]